MGLLDRIRRAWARRGGSNQLQVTYGNPWGPEWRERIAGMSVAKLYATQPHLQAVVAFRALNMAQLPLHLYRIHDGEHEKQNGPLSSLFTQPNPDSTGFELIRDTVATLDLHGRTYWMVLPDPERRSGWQIRHLNPAWVTGVGGTIWTPEKYTVRVPGGDAIDVPASAIVPFAAFAPNGIDEAAPVAALKDIMAEQVAAWEYRRQVWQKAGRVGGYIHRPVNAPEWSDKSFERFSRSWHEFQAKGERAGETPILEEGMELRNANMSAREQEWAEVTRLSLQTVAQVYHVPPSMIGAQGTATYASARVYANMLYTETLGPIIRQLEQRINQFVLPIVEPDDPDLAVKFNIDAKLAGSFEEQAAVMSSAVGGPWMKRNEARALRNLPPVDGGDELIVPLNVATGGQASPRDGGTPSVAMQNAARLHNHTITEGPDNGNENI